jgi:hypothetical protein
VGLLEGFRSDHFLTWQWTMKGQHFPSHSLSSKCTFLGHLQHIQSPLDTSLAFIHSLTHSLTHSLISLSHYVGPDPILGHRNPGFNSWVLIQVEIGSSYFPLLPYHYFSEVCAVSGFLSLLG